MEVLCSCLITIIITIIMKITGGKALLLFDDPSFTSRREERKHTLDRLTALRTDIFAKKLYTFPAEVPIDSI